MKYVLFFHFNHVKNSFAHFLAEYFFPHNFNLEFFYCDCSFQVKESVVNNKGFIFYLQEVEFLYNDVHRSQLTLGAVL